MTESGLLEYLDFLVSSMPYNLSFLFCLSGWEVETGTNPCVHSTKWSLLCSLRLQNFKNQAVGTFVQETSYFAHFISWRSLLSKSYHSYIGCDFWSSKIHFLIPESQSEGRNLEKCGYSVINWNGNSFSTTDSVMKKAMHWFFLQRNSNFLQKKLQIIVGHDYRYTLIIRN